MGCISSNNSNNNNNNNKKDENLLDKTKKDPVDIHKQYLFQKTLGKGASCRVVEAIDKSNRNNKLAIKIMSKDKPLFAQLYSHEVTILSKLTHPNIIQLKGHQEDESNYYVITKLCEGGELFDRIVSDQYKITEKVAAKLVHDMLVALKYCHDQNIVHRDLKPENFVFETKDENANIVLIDFGCAKLVSDEEEYKDIVGTVYYLAPELAAQQTRIIRTGKILKSADIWSIGVIAYVMLTGRPPFKGRSNKEIFTQIIKEPLTFPDDINLSDSFKDFVRKTLVKNPYNRINLEEALLDPWVQGKTAGEYQLNRDVIRYLRQFNYQSKLKKAITRCLASNMSEEPEKEVRTHFERLDKDGDGFLDAEELKLLLLDMGFAPSSAKTESQLMLEAADLNKDGSIDFSEFKAIWHRKLLSQHEQYIHRVFAVFDDNGDGYIDSKELQGVLGDDFATIADMIAEVDDNKDNKISFEEFKKAMQEDMASGKFQANNVSPGVGGANIEDLPDETLSISPSPDEN